MKETLLLQPQAKSIYFSLEEQKELFQLDGVGSRLPDQ